MKNFKFIAIFTLLTLFTSCSQPGVTSQSLNGTEDELPQELKGLKVYRVSTGSGNYVKVAILNDNINSLTYQNGKLTETVIIVNKNVNGSKVIEVKEILMENDSMIVCKK